MLIDYYSSFTIIRNMVTNNIKEVRVVPNSIFGEYGLLKEFITDNGLCYTATNLKSFASQDL